MTEGTCGLFWSCFALYYMMKTSAPRVNWMVESQVVWKGRWAVTPRGILIQGQLWKHKGLFIREGSLSSLPLPMNPRPRNLRNGSPNPLVQSVCAGWQAFLANRVCAFHWVSDKPWAKSELPALCSVVWDLLTLWGVLTLTCPLIYDFYWVFCEVVNWTTLQLVWALIRKLSSKWITFSVSDPLLKFIAKAEMFSATCL